MTPTRKSQTGARANKTGQAAEDAAVRLLISEGAEILARRLRPPETGAGEIDILAREAGALVIIEVKARATLDAALEALSAAQCARLAGAAEWAAAQPQWAASDLRIDLIAVDRTGRAARLRNISVSF